ncbi:hypothetical protein ABEO83_17165 [Bacillus glycinifermentans]|nr:hypothetical protein [Bacillus glycinifermentans]
MNILQVTSSNRRPELGKLIRGSLSFGTLKPMLPKQIRTCSTN